MGQSELNSKADKSGPEFHTLSEAEYREFLVSEAKTAAFQDVLYRQSGSIEGALVAGRSILADYIASILAKAFRPSGYEVVEVRASECGEFTVKIRERGQQ